MTLDGTERLVYRAPSPLTIRDISVKGEVLLTRDDTRFGITGRGPGNSREVDYSWFDFSLAIGISPDGKMLLFEEAGGEGTFIMYLRKLDGSPAVRLGEGSAQAFSPDGKGVLACTGKVPRQLFLLPVGAGQRRALTNDSLNHTAAAWLPDGKRILFEGNEPGRPLRLYVQRIDGGPPIPVTPEGTSYMAQPLTPPMISADGQSVVIRAPDGSPSIYNIKTSAAQPLKGFQEDDRLIRCASPGRGATLP